MTIARARRATRITLPKLGLGAAPLGSTGGFFGEVTDEAAVRTVEHCLNRGVTFFDTAPLYGSGLSESRLGKALAGVPRHHFQIATKVGAVVNADGSLRYSYRRDAVKQSIEQSLQRLQLDRVEVAHIHDVGPEGLLHVAIEEAYEVLADFKAQGVIGAIGAGMNHWEPEAELARQRDFDCFLLAGRYTLLEQEPLAEYFPLCQKKGISVFLAGVYNTGILATGSIPNAQYQYGPAPAHILAKTRQIEAVCARHAVPLKAAALQFALAHPVVTTLVVGMKSPAEVDQNLAALHAPIPAAFWAELHSQGLMDPAAPTPTHLSTQSSTDGAKYQ